VSIAFITRADARLNRVDMHGLVDDAAAAAISLATGVVVGTILIFALSPLLGTTGVLGLLGRALHSHPASGAVAVLFAMAVPLHWSVPAGHIGGSFALLSTMARYPAVAASSALVFALVAACGLVVSRRRADDTVARAIAPAVLSFVALSLLIGFVVSHGRPAVVGPIRAELSVSLLQVALRSAIFAVAGMSAGAWFDRRQTTRPTRETQVKRWTVRGPAAAAVAAAVALTGLGACGGGSAGDTVASHSRTNNIQAATGPASTSPSSALDPGSAATTAAATATGGSTDSAAAKPAHEGTTASSSATTRPASVAGPHGLAPATPGVYSYDTAGSASSFLTKATFPAVTTLTVDPAKGTTQHSVRRLTSSNGDGFVIEQTLDYQPQGISVTQQKMTVTLSGKKSVRTLVPSGAALSLPTGATAGSHQTIDLTGQGLNAHEVVDVVQSVQQLVGGQSVTTLLMKTVLSLTGSATGTIELDQWLAPTVRLPAKEHLQGSIKAGLISVNVHYDATLQKLTPS
jgi:hypothetical protein